MSESEPDGTPAPPNVSFAQNGEDIVLGRGLTGSRGFYVDVGAYDPDVESVTKYFYERGWRGINVEPIASFIDRFRAARPRDINVCAAIGLDDGEQEIWVSPDHIPGHSTLDPEVAASHDADGHPGVARTVRVMRLDTLFANYLPPNQTIDFLKVDVEGGEEAVLASWDTTGVRPRVVVVEAMAPYIEGSTHSQWEPILLGAGYSLALFDGLNRYYVRDDEPELAAVLSAPANILDNFETAGFKNLRTYVSLIEIELREWKSYAASLFERVAWLEQRLADAGRDAITTEPPSRVSNAR